jgi:uncharacterized membrane protein YqaE (UPF0057 family)
MPPAGIFMQRGWNRGFILAQILPPEALFFVLRLDEGLSPPFCIRV